MPRAVYRELKLLARRQRAAFVLVQRARMILLARDGIGTREIARRVACDERTVRKWKQRFGANPTLAGLEDEPRSGRPPRVPTWVRCRLIQLACDRPDGVFTPFREVWTRRALAEALALWTGVRLSVSEVGRILRNAELRPHRVRLWLHSPDPDFEAKADATGLIGAHRHRDHRRPRAHDEKVRGGGRRGDDHVERVGEGSEVMTPFPRSTAPGAGLRARPTS